MAKRMKFSVVGLPHYTVWHLYEPSVDDIRHMEEMEQERKNREKEEKERAERMKKIKDEFNEPNKQWEKDKTELKDIAAKEETENKADGSSFGDAQGPIAQPVKEDADPETTTRSTEVTSLEQPGKGSIRQEEIKGSIPADGDKKVQANSIKKNLK